MNQMDSDGSNAASLCTLPFLQQTKKNLIMIFKVFYLFQLALVVIEDYDWSL